MDSVTQRLRAALSQGARRALTITGLLLGVDFLDEFAGVGSVSAPDIQGELGISYAAASLILFTVPMFAGILLEPPIYVLADRFPRKGFVVGGIAAMGVMLVCAGFASGPWTLGIAISAWAVASGVGVGLAQATLMDAHPEDREQVMTRWVFMGALGDLATPALVAGLALVTLGWREAFFVVGALMFAYAALLSTRDFPDEGGKGEDNDEEDEPPLREAIRAAVGNRGLLLWLFGSSLCAMLDEVLIAFGALYLTVALDASITERGALLFVMIIGDLIGLRATEVLLAKGVRPMRLLAVSSALCVLAFLGWLAAPTLLTSAALGVLVGVFTGPQYPIVKAQAYRALPGRSGMVNAVGVLFTPVEVVLPLAVGLVADHYGLRAALAVLLIQPVGLGLIATLSVSRPASPAAR